MVNGEAFFFAIGRKGTVFLPHALIEGAPFLNDRSIISKIKGRLPQRPQRHLGQAGQRRAVGAAASRDPDAGDVGDQKFGDCFRVQARGDIAFALRIVNAGYDGSAQAFA
ncbi:hypothetical protein BPNPMPFG_003665 [Mesorhizobium sp. AR07]|uniref:hypothetical protein n=1 Tax=Mesorhizobium sp. AR07 TaxID=2865838 RepID=UPI00215EC486|nr:hypothetical protein [Mesorhizobium sp. AR07]UVK42025.1 hypothetical protein BPNPMPFG_003665 [Mesorhizobium sp. AR07]